MVNLFLKIVGFTSVFMAVFLLSPLKSAQAGVDDNIRGLAYNINYGYISFNCLDDDFAGRFPFTFPFTFNIPPCSIPHGVNLGANNNFSGDAWNSFLGLVTFNSTSTPVGLDLSSLDNCENTCQPANNCTACYKESEEKVYGYMRVVSTGEWIKLDNNNPLIQPKVQITNYQAASQPGIFSGYATSTFGDISFNCKNDNSCALNNYWVRIGPLEIRQMSAPNWDASLACNNGANRATLKWTIRSGSQSAYQIIVSTQNSTSSGVIINSTVSSTVPQASNLLLAYDTSYYWFLRLWDNTGVITPWRQFNVNPISKDWISDNYNYNLVRSPNPNLTFTSYRYEFPRPIFTWTPEEIVIATTSNSFISNSIYYSNNNTPQSCTPSTCAFNWSTSDLAAEIMASTSATTSISFTRATNTVVTLTTTDNIDPSIYTCSTSTILNINYALPLWKEVKASSSTP